MLTIYEILQAAKATGASDVHLTVGLPPKMRVNGQLESMDYSRLLPSDTLDVLLQIMTETQRERFEERGEYDMAISVPELGRCRVNAYKQSGYVALAFRLIGEKIPSPRALGIPEAIMELSKKQSGLVLVTGGAGSGKTTTLAAIIDMINNNRNVHVITLEEPIEYLHRHKCAMIHQREIGLDSVDYRSALCGALREDADVIMLGELRDYETIAAAIDAAETGHLVLATMNTFGVSEAVESLIESFPAHKQQRIRVRLANVLEAVVYQRLLPTEGLGGRVADFEILHANATVRQLICENNPRQLIDYMNTNP